MKITLNRINIKTMIKSLGYALIIPTFVYLLLFLIYKSTGFSFILFGIRTDASYFTEIIPKILVITILIIVLAFSYNVFSKYYGGVEIDIELDKETNKK